MKEPLQVDNFSVLITQAIRRTIDKKTVEVFQLFNEELNLVKKEFNTKTVALPPMYPKYAGSSTWARALKRRIDKPMTVSCPSTGKEAHSKGRPLAVGIGSLIR